LQDEEEEDWDVAQVCGGREHYKSVSGKPRMPDFFSLIQPSAKKIFKAASSAHTAHFLLFNWYWVV
jgi:hypothetical protein